MAATANRSCSSSDLAEQLDSLTSKSGLSRREVGYLIVGLADVMGLF